MDSQLPITMLRNADSEEGIRCKETRDEKKGENEEAGSMNTDTSCMLHGYVRKEENLVRMLQHHRQMDDDSKKRSSASTD